MISFRTHFTGDEWQEWGNQLVLERYGIGNYQRIPDITGDAGIEGFAVSEGHAYQLYACQEPLTPEARYIKHRKKMSDDIKKFINNSGILAKFFGETKITRWILFVPLDSTKEIISHASKKTGEVLDANLAYVYTNDFRVVVHSQKEFVEEANKILNRSPIDRTLCLDPPDISDAQKTDWATMNDPLVKTVDDKIAKVPTCSDEKRRIILRTTIIEWYLKHLDIQDQLRSIDPELYEKLQRTIQQRESYIASESLSYGTAYEIYRSTLEKLKEAIGQGLPLVHSDTCEALAQGTVSDWLLRCPLDF